MEQKSQFLALICKVELNPANFNLMLGANMQQCVTIHHYAVIKKPRFYNPALFTIFPIHKYLLDKEVTV